jgi:hypothetical protein
MLHAWQKCRMAEGVLRKSERRTEGAGGCHGGSEAERNRQLDGHPLWSIPLGGRRRVGKKITGRGKMAVLSKLLDDVAKRS